MSISKLLIFIPLITALLTIHSIPLQASMITGEEKVYILTESLTVHNRDNETQSRGLITLTIPCSIPPWQEVKILSITPASHRTTLDNDGNVLLETALPPLGKGEKFTVTVKTEVTSQRVLFDIDPSRLPPFPEALSSYWTGTPVFPSEDRLFTRTAEEVVGKEKNPYHQSLLLYDFVRSFTYRLSDDPRPAIQALETRKVQCSDAVAVLITLLRALKIPSRYVAGISLVEGKSSIVHTHAWAEIYFPGEGWVPLDPTLSRFNEGARLTRFAEHEPGQILFSLNRMNPYVISLEKGAPLKKGNMEISFSYTEKKVTGQSAISDYYYKKISPPGDRSRHKEEDPYGRISPSGKKQFDSAMSFQRKGELKEAGQMLETLLSMESRYIPAWKKLIEMSGINGRADLERRRKEFMKWKEKDGGDPLPCMLLGLVAVEMRENSSACQHYKDAEKQGMKSPHLSNSMGYLAIMTKQYGLSVESYSKTLELDSADLMSLGNLMNFFSLYRGWDSVASLSMYAMDQHHKGPFEPYFAASYALALIEKKDNDRALAFLLPSLKKWPRDGWLTCLTGLAYYRKGEKAAARNLLTQGLDLNPPDRAFFEKTLREIQRKDSPSHRN